MEYNSDKYGSGLIGEYEKILLPYKDRTIKYLEVGIYRGGSLHWASEFFGKDATIVGIDKDLPPEQDFPENIKIFVANQSNEIQLKEVADNYKEFDIIIDDGCHETAETGNTFDALYSYLKTGGVYIIEDFGANMLPKFKGMFVGMPEMVHHIAIMAKQLDISRYEIKHNFNFGNGSYAAFWKGNA